MPSLEIVSQSSQQTKQLGQWLAEELLSEKIKTRQALVLGLIGPLGSGKTSFVQGLGQGLGLAEKITSPTFVLLKKYSLGQSASFKFFYHLDCYRLDKYDQLADLGWPEILSQKTNLVAIEWADRVKKLISQSSLLFSFKIINAQARLIQLNY